jgi:hypothetical protein
VVPYKIAEYLDRRGFATLYGLSWTAYAIGGATGPILMGHSFDTAGIYVPAIVLMFSVPCFVAAFLQLLLPFRVRPLAQVAASYLAFDSPIAPSSKLTLRGTLNATH